MQGVLVMGAVLGTWATVLCQMTIIRGYLLALVALLVGATLTPIFSQSLNRRAVGHWTLHLVFHVTVAGGGLSWAFLSLNYYFADAEREKATVEIVRHTSVGRYPRRAKQVVFVYAGAEKMLPGGSERCEKARNVELVLRQGFLGFEVVDDHQCI